MPDQEKSPESVEPGGPIERRPQQIVSVCDLLGEEREILLEHKGQHYRLRITSNDKNPGVGVPSDDGEVADDALVLGMRTSLNC